MTHPDIASLLHEPESSSLDFKRDQYRFEGASDDEKSELLKDILAFANSWRRGEAYILVGIAEVRGGRSQVVGVARHLDDAKLQQFVNSKTQRPIRFNYYAAMVDGAEVGVISVPVQERPFFLRKDYGRLKRNVVYLRHGSATAEADPDEIVRMAKSRIDGEREAYSRLEQRAGQEWRIIERQALTSLALSFAHRHEMSVADFMTYVAGISIRILAHSHADAYLEQVSLGFRSLHDAGTDLEKRFGLVAANSKGPVATSDGVAFSRRLTDEEQQQREPFREVEPVDRGPNEKTDLLPRSRSVVGPIAAVAMICDGWAYISSNKDVWSDPTQLVCGVRGSLKWSSLPLGPLCATVHGLGSLQRLEVNLPSGFDLRPADEFDITWFSSGNEVFTLRLENLRFSQEKSGSWGASITGPELYVQLAAGFVEARIRKHAESDDAG
jgi:hypothetical protein